MISDKYRPPSIEEAVLDFMINQMHIYVNKNNVEIVMNADHSFIVGADLGDGATDDDISIEVVTEYDTVGEFIKVFGIVSSGCIKDIIPAYLMSLYYEGRAEISCIIDGYFSYNLDFRIVKDKMIATDGDGMEHEVPVKLEMPEELIDYTRRYYQLELENKTN